MPLPNIQLPGSSNDDGDGNGGDSKGDLIISDVIGKERSINMFAGFIRDTEQASSRLDDGQRNSTILAPLNSQIQKLPRKPWEDPEEYKALGAEAYAGNEGEDRAHRNLRRFVEAHIVPKSPWAKEERMKTMSGNEVWWEEKDGKKVVRLGPPTKSISYLPPSRSSQATSKLLILHLGSQTGRFGSSAVYSTMPSD